jgi:hypothetical protein
MDLGVASLHFSELILFERVRLRCFANATTQSSAPITPTLAVRFALVSDDRVWEKTGHPPEGRTF